MRTTQSAVTLVIVLLAISGKTLGQNNAAIPEGALDTANTLIVNHQYRRAEDRISRLIRQYPDESLAQIQAVVLYFTWIDDFGTADAFGPRLMSAIARTIQVADRALAANPRNAYAHFAKGSALAYRSLFRSYVEGISITGNAWSLMREANSGIDHLETAYEIDPGFADPLIGIGKYRHWKAHKLPRPFASPSDAREGVRMLEDAIRRGLRWQEGAVQTLGWIYVGDGRFNDAIALVGPMAAKYPESRFFQEILGRAYMGKKDYARAERIFAGILDGLSPEERASNFIVMKYRRWVAKLALEQEDYERACRTAYDLRRLTYPGVHKDWLDRKTGLISDVATKACPKAQRQQQRR